MKREIRFRAFLEIGESNEIRAMIENVVVYNESHDGNVGCFFPDMKEQIVEQTGFDYSEEDESFYKGDKRVPIEDEVSVDEDWAFFQGELMQFTGLKDKDGNDIYEGDIIRVCYESVDEEGNDISTLHSPVGYVAWNEHSTGWIVRTKSPMSVESDGTVMTSIIHGSAGFREILGNIHATPELLEA